MAQGELRGVVAMDGPSGTGKSTVARGLASALGAGYLDTGAMYRAVTLAVLRAGTDPADGAAVLRVAEGVDLGIGTDPADRAVTLGGEDVSAEIRGPQVTAAVSAVSAVAGVRDLLVARQRLVISETRARSGGIVVEGRDIGTVVAPDAPLKVYLTASADARAARRSAQDAREGRTSTVDATRADVERRDTFDSTRAVSPLRPAVDAIEVDTTDLGVEAVLERLLAVVRERGLGAAVPGAAGA
ncbi:(d)CMP kinase [Actinokineospora bangkokensis]|uniref:(d)CMP kinase n=1 Tax=Actinokineospora bangkokensis TaxID=1193682 RepID=UPI000ABE2232|nr:(d)CMP kinase [Actinokineospora bangkokensis]